MEKIKLRRKRSLGFATTKKLFATAKRFATAKAVAHCGAEETRWKTSLGFAKAKNLFVVVNVFATVKMLFTAVKRKLIERSLIGSLRRRCCSPRGRHLPQRRLLLSMVKGKLFEKHIFSLQGEERIYVSILVFSQSRLLSHNSRACKFFPNT